MTDELNRSHDPALVSWVESANGHPEFPIQNLPYGATEEDGVVVAIGDMALPLAAIQRASLDPPLPAPRDAFDRARMNRRMVEASPEEWTALRLRLSDMLSDPGHRDELMRLLRPISELSLVPPFSTGDYTDFYASINHARNVGSLFRPDNPLLPNYKWVPIGYHGRSSTLVPDGTPIRRPVGQTRPGEDGEPPVGPSAALDHELELGLVLRGENPIGSTVPAAAASERIFGVVLLNDWSARDLQAWEYQPLGPFLAKNFATTLSPWVVTRDALLPYRVAMPARPDGDPKPLPYLRVPADTTWTIELEVELHTAAMRSRGDEPFRLSRTRFEESMYWSPSQLVTHHGSNGCRLVAGDLLGTGTISGTEPGSRGCLLEITRRAAEPVQLPDGTERGFLEDGDEVTLRGHAVAEGRPSIGFGRCSGRVIGA